MLCFALNCDNSGSTVKHSSSITTSGIPPVPDSLQRQIRQQLNLQYASLVNWTDSGLVVLRRTGETSQLYRILKPGDSLIPLTNLDESVVNAWVCPVWPRSRVLFTRDSGGNERFRIYSLNLASGRRRLLTANTAQNDGAVWSNSGDRFAYSGNLRNGIDFDVCICPVDSPAIHRTLITAGGMWGPADWSPDDHSLLVGRYRSRTSSRLYICDVASGTFSPLTETTEIVSQELGAWGPGGNGVFFTSDHRTDFRGLHYLDQHKHHDSLLTAAVGWDIRDFSISPDRSTLAFTTNEHGFTGVYLMDTRTFVYKKVSGLPRGVILTPRFHPTGTSVAFSISTPSAPDDVFEYDLTAQTLVQWTDHSGQDSNMHYQVVPRVISYPTFDSINGSPRMIPCIVYKPAAHQVPSPVLIVIHGGPESQFWPSYKPDIVYYVNELGFAVLAPNVRGSGGYGKHYLTLDDGTNRENAVWDIGALLDWIARQPDLDPARVAVTGGSYGGFISLASMVRYNSRLRAGIDNYGIGNFVTFLENTSGYRQDLRRVEYGDERDPVMRKFLTGISPLTHVDNITKPLLIVQGANDPRVPLSESQQIEAALRKKGTPVWFLVAADEGHGFRKRSNREFQEAVTVLFLKRYLLGE